MTNAEKPHRLVDLLNCTILPFSGDTRLLRDSLLSVLDRVGLRPPLQVGQCASCGDPALLYSTRLGHADRCFTCGTRERVLLAEVRHLRQIGLSPEEIEAAVKMALEVRR